MATDETVTTHDSTLAGRIVWFVMATAVMVIFSMVTTWAMSQNSRMERMEERQAAVEKSLARFETKLDMLLDRRDGSTAGARK